MSVDMTVIPSAFGGLQEGLAQAGGLATTAAAAIRSVDPGAFTPAAAGVAASGLTPALRGATDICGALGTTTRQVGDRLGATATLYRQVEEEGVALASTITSTLDAVTA